MPGLDPNSLVPIATATLRSGANLPFDLYLLPGNTSRPILYRERRFPLDDQEIATLQNRDIRTLFIAFGGLRDYEHYLRESLLHDDTISPAQKLGTIREANRSQFHDAMKQKSLGPVVDLMTRMGNEYAQLVADRETNAIELLKVLEHDYYTYTHVTNVCTYCLLLARGIGIHDAESLREIAAGALLHDVGKRAVPASILNKPGRLTSEEMRIMQRHPTSGFRELVHRDDVTFGQLMMVYQHHERLNGSGYPVQSTGDEIHLWARICAIADVFDALTCYCPYRHPMPSAEVLRLLENGAPDSYDQELVNCWSSLLKQSS